MVEENSCRLVVDSVRGTLDTIQHFKFSECCIYRVPEKFRKLNEAAYTPRVVSIGPFHHGKKELATMEKQYKVIYLNHFLQRATRRMSGSLEDFATVIKDQEDSIRKCYYYYYEDEGVQLSSDEFVKMVLLDASFIIEFFLRSCNFLDDGEGDLGDDRILNNRWLVTDIRYDLKLLENQLPFFVLRQLYNKAFAGSNQGDNTLSNSFFRLTYCFYFGDRARKFPRENVTIYHFTDLLLHLQLPRSQGFNTHKVTLIHPWKNATYLNKAGVRFNVEDSEEAGLLDIEFNNGVLKIPRVVFDERTESLMRNLMAYERCHYSHGTYLHDYVYLMSVLIRTAKDVKLLARNGILVNSLGDSDAVIVLVNQLSKEIVVDKHKFYFSQLCEKLNEYNVRAWHNRRFAFSIGGGIVIVLTLIQTVCAIIPFFPFFKFKWLK